MVINQNIIEKWNLLKDTWKDIIDQNSIDFIKFDKFIQIIQQLSKKQNNYNYDDIDKDFVEINKIVLIDTKGIVNVINKTLYIYNSPFDLINLKLKYCPSAFIMEEFYNYLIKYLLNIYNIDKIEYINNYSNYNNDDDDDDNEIVMIENNDDDDDDDTDNEKNEE